jgi:hypothetical protein
MEGNTSNAIKLIIKERQVRRWGQRVKSYSAIIAAASPGFELWLVVGVSESGEVMDRWGGNVGMFSLIGTIR